MTLLQNVNTTDIGAAIRLGCRTMQNIFNADDHNVPFFGSTAWPYAALWFSPDLSECHVPGRHLNALLAAEATTGLQLDPAAVENHRRAAFFSFSGPIALPLNRQTPDGPLVNFSPHNLREGLHALYALAVYRQDPQAAALAERLIATVFDLWDPLDGWDVGRFHTLGLNFQATQGPLNGETRMLGPLVKYFRATHYAPALELALLLKEQALARFFEPADSASGLPVRPIIYDHPRFITDHTHSITSSLSSLAQLADLLDDAVLLQRVKGFYDCGLWAMRDEIGWTPGGVFNRDSDQGEAGNGGDILETALILGRHGYPEYYHDAERILRLHLLPAQLRDVSWMRDTPDPNCDGLRQAADRHLGAYGLPTPYGHLSVGKDKQSIGFYMDIVGSVVGSLCAAYQEMNRCDHTGHWVNLLFDHDSLARQVESPYTHDGLHITLKQPGPLFIRIPPWVEPGEIALTGGHTPRWVNGYLFLADLQPGETLSLRFPLKESTLTLSERVHPRPIRVRLRGDAPLAMDHFGTDLTFFAPFEA